MSRHKEERTKETKTEEERSHKETGATQLETIQTAASLLASWGTSSEDLPSIPALPANLIPIIKNSVKQIDLRKTTSRVHKQYLPTQPAVFKC